jgi:hypothetical protein
MRAKDTRSSGAGVHDRAVCCQRVAHHSAHAVDGATCERPPRQLRPLVAVNNGVAVRPALVDGHAECIGDKLEGEQPRSPQPAINTEPVRVRNAPPDARWSLEGRAAWGKGR